MLSIYKETTSEFVNEVFSDPWVKEELKISIQNYLERLLDGGYVVLRPSVPKAFVNGRSDDKIGVVFTLEILDNPDNSLGWSPGIEEVVSEIIAKNNEYLKAK